MNKFVELTVDDYIELRKQLRDLKKKNSLLELQIKTVAVINDVEMQVHRPM
jgi:hypothetical protein